MKFSRNEICTLIALIGLLLVIAGCVMPFFSLAGRTFRYVFCTGAAMVLLGRLFTTHPDASLRLRRIYRMEVWSGVAFCIAGFFMFHPGSPASDWLAFALVGGALQIIASIMAPKVASGSKE